MNNELPNVQIYSIGPDEVNYAAALLTGEAIDYIKNGEALGMALVEEDEIRAAVCARLSPDNEMILELISLYVAPAYRRRGLGGTLLMELLDEMMAVTDGSLLGVIANFMPDMEGLEAFFSKDGFRLEQDEQVLSWKFTVADLADSILLKQRVPVPENYSIQSLKKLSDYEVHQLVNVLRQNWVDDRTEKEMRLALQSDSYVLLDERKRPRACVVLEKQEEKHIYLSQCFVDKGNTVAGMLVLQEAAKSVREHFSEDTVLEIPTLAASSAGLVKKILPMGQPTKLIRAVLELTD